MFKFEEIKVKLIIGGIILAVIGLLGWTAKHYYDANLVNKLEVDRLVLANQDLERQFELFKISKDIDNAIIADQRKSMTSMVEVSNQNALQVSVDVKKVLDKYSKLPQTDANIQQRDNEVSTVRIVGLWKTHCTLHPASPTCEQFKKE